MSDCFDFKKHLCVCVFAREHTHRGRYPGNKGNRKLTAIHTVHYNSNIQLQAVHLQLIFCDRFDFI